MTVQRNLTTTASDRNSDSTADSKPKSTRRKSRSSPKTAGKAKKKEKKTEKEKKKKKKKRKVVAKPKVTINSEVLPPKMPGNPFTQWLRDWLTTQPKNETLKIAQNNIKRGSQIWNELPEDEKQQYREKTHALMDEYRRRMEEWREKVDPAVLRELNRRRVAKGHNRIRGPRRPMNGFVRFYMHVRSEYPRAEEDQKTHFKATAERASSQWRAMSDAEKAEYNDVAKADFAAWREKRRPESQAKA